MNTCAVVPSLVVPKGLLTKPSPPAMELAVVPSKSMGINIFRIGAEILDCICNPKVFIEYKQGSAFVYIFANDMRTLSENENERVREHVFVFVYAILSGLGLPSGVSPQKKMTLRNLGGHAGSGGRGH